MKRVIVFILLVFICNRAYAEQLEVSKLAEKKEPVQYNEEAADKVYAHSLYEYSWVKQGSRKGNWRIFSNRLAYLKDNLQAVYLDSTSYGRFGVNDYTLELGSYQKLQNGYIHEEIGVATSHVDYIYKAKGLLEIEQKIADNWFINLDTRYLHHTSHDSGDVRIVSPSLIHYFGNSYISVGYGISFTQHRDSAQFGVVKGNFAINDRVNLWLGTALGERLFDIDLLKASKQYGSIFFCGLDIVITKNITFRIDGSYSKERPSFIKRSIDFGTKIKF